MSIHAIAGPMFSGKTLRLIQEFENDESPADRKIVVKPRIDDRYSIDEVASHCGKSIPAVCIGGWDEFMPDMANFDHVFVDEVQFMDSEATSAKLMEASRNGISITVSGLDMDSFGVPFESMSLMLALADEVTKLKGKCHNCGTHDGTMTWRQPDASADRVAVGGTDMYQCRCVECWLKE